MRTKKFSYLLVAGAMILSLSTITNVNAQNGRFSVGAELGLPMGTFGDAAGIGFGGSLRYEMPMGDNLGLMATAGFLSFSGKDYSAFGITVKGLSQTMIPIQVGAKYYFTEQQEGFYGSLELGVHMSSYTVPGTDPIVVSGITVYPGTEDETVSATNLSYAPGIGYHLANLDLGLKYQIISGDGGSSSYLGVRVAYVFGEK